MEVVVFFPGGAQSNVVALLHTLSIFNFTSAPFSHVLHRGENVVKPDLLNAGILMSPRHLDYGGYSYEFTGGSAGNFTERQPPSAGIMIIQV